MAAGTVSDKIAHGLWAVYDRELPKDVRKVVEIGVYNGDSLRLLRKKYPNAVIIGVDCSPCLSDPGEDFIFVRMDQTDTALGTLCLDADVVIDDASHIGSLTQQTFDNIWPNLKPGARYFIEDWTPWMLPDMGAVVDAATTRVLSEGGAVQTWLDEPAVAKDASLALFIK